MFGGIKASSRWVCTAPVAASAATDFACCLTSSLSPAKAQLSSSNKRQAEEFEKCGSGTVARSAVMESGPASCHHLQVSVGQQRSGFAPGSGRGKEPKQRQPQQPEKHHSGGENSFRQKIITKRVINWPPLNFPPAD